MKVANREELIILLERSVSHGAIYSVVDADLRDIRCKSVDGFEFTIEWFMNLCTVKTSSMHIWFDSISISTCHPCFEVCIELSYQGNSAAHIGKIYDHLKETK